MKEAANSLLKLLEEPPDHTSLILLTENPQELLPTIRSRAVIHRLGAIPAADLESLLARRRPELKPQDRALVARLAMGAVGRALSLDLATYLSSREDALVILRTAIREPDYSPSFMPPKVIAPAPMARRKPSISSARSAVSLKISCSSWQAPHRSSATSISPPSLPAYQTA